MTCPLPGVIESCQTVQVLHHCSRLPMGRCGTTKLPCRLCVPPEATRKRVIEVIKDITPQATGRGAAAIAGRDSRLLKEAIKRRPFLETIVNGIEDHMMVIDLDYQDHRGQPGLAGNGGFRNGMKWWANAVMKCRTTWRSPCTSPDHPCPLKDAVATGKAASATHVHFDKDGREHYHSCGLSPAV